MRGTFFESVEQPLRHEDLFEEGYPKGRLFSTSQPTSHDAISCGLTACQLGLHGVAPMTSIPRARSAWISCFFSCGTRRQSVDSTILACAASATPSNNCIFLSSSLPIELQQITPSMSRKIIRRGGASSMPGQRW